MKGSHSNKIREHIPAPSVGHAIRIKTRTRRQAFLRSMRLPTTVLIFATAFFPVEAATGPLGVSQTGRYFVDANGEPFFFLRLR